MYIRCGTLLLVPVLWGLLSGCPSKEQPLPTPEAPATPAGPRRLAIHVSSKGFVPAKIAARAGEPLVLSFTYDKSAGECGREVLIPVTDPPIRKELQADQPVEVALTLPSDKKELVFTCGMKMFRGVLVLQ